MISVFIDIKSQTKYYLFTLKVFFIFLYFSKGGIISENHKAEFHFTGTIVFQVTVEDIVRLILKESTYIYKMVKKYISPAKFLEKVLLLNLDLKIISSRFQKLEDLTLMSKNILARFSCSFVFSSKTIIKRGKHKCFYLFWIKKKNNKLQK